MQGWGLLYQFPPFHYFQKFSALFKHIWVIEYHIYIWQVSPQLSCGDTCQIWMWFNKSNSSYGKIKHFAYRVINERSLTNPIMVYPILIRQYCFIESGHRTHNVHTMSFSFTFGRMELLWTADVWNRVDTDGAIKYHRELPIYSQHAVRILYTIGFEK